jgi:hypothetical protein
LNSRELQHQALRRDHLALERLNRRLEQADQDDTIREELLTELSFIPSPVRRPWFRWSRVMERYFHKIPIIALVPLLLIDLIAWRLGLRTFFSPLLTVIAGYRTWRRSRINSTVDDALKRKDMANAVIMDNPELLSPYVESALTVSKTTSRGRADPFLNAKVDMYIYSEIDNLEFVFDKSNHGLVDEQFVMRAIKIFIARNENYLFRLRSEELLDKGRYNHDFALAAEKLIVVAEWRNPHRTR